MKLKTAYGEYEITGYVWLHGDGSVVKIKPLFPAQLCYVECKAPDGDLCGVIARDILNWDELPKLL